MDAVVFDLGNVLIGWDPLRVVSEEFVAGADFHAWNAQLDRGVPFDDVVARWCEAHPDHADEVRVFQERWFETLGAVDDDVLAIVHDLRAQGVAVFGLTNSSAENAPRSPAVQRVFAELDGVVISGEVGLLKPHPEIYDHTAQRFGLTPARTWFVDDNAANVAGAVDCGWNAVLFTDATSLRAELEAAGILR
ncbi:MAG TPA: HAD family phosphatase [Acidimicrobiales bacterium]|nr:HAD family phosphatase [Acidimicrobiales bacterium]